MFEQALERLKERQAVVGVIGLGYVGLPLALAFCDAGCRTIGFDIDPDKPTRIHAGRSYLKSVPEAGVRRAVAAGLLSATTDFGRLAEPDVLIICVPTPLTKHMEPDLSFVQATATAIAEHLRPGQLVVLESTTYPGTTTEVVRPVLEAGGLVPGRDFWLAFSPEREDPGNPNHSTASIPKVVGADDHQSRRLAKALYETFTQTVTVSSSATAEAVKLTENIFRAVNIALVNELKGVFKKMDVNIWEVVDAAKTKPFGYMPFYPGPGLGGHCIPIDPFYLTWKAREYGLVTRFIELSGEINRRMPELVIEDLAMALDRSSARGLNGARVLVCGVAYKKNIDDTRESPALRMMDLLRARGSNVDYYDPHVPAIPATREHPELTGFSSIAWDPTAIAQYDAVVVVTDHDDVDYRGLANVAKLVVDTRNACPRAGADLTRVTLA